MLTMQYTIFFIKYNKAEDSESTRKVNYFLLPSYKQLRCMKQDLLSELLLVIVMMARDSVSLKRIKK
jgi:hypothetical protein